MICPLCNKEFKQITKQHLDYAHGISTLQFKKEFPETSLGNPDNAKRAIKINEIRQTEQTIYESDPKRCQNCNEPIIYKKYKNRNANLRDKPFYCSHKCAAIVHNTNKVHSIASNIKRSITLKNLPKNYPKSPIFYIKCKICGHTKIVQSKETTTCSKTCRSKILSKAARKSGLGGNHNRRSSWYESPNAGKVHLESSWELLLATELDKHNIKWCRPSCMPWIDFQNIRHNYFPDFYSFTHDIYIEPKNDYLLQKDMYKLEYVIKKYGISILVITDPTLLKTDTILKYSRNKGLTIL